MWNGLDRRRFPRAKYRCRINIKRQHLPPKTTSTYTENIGIGGICVVVDEDLQIFHNVYLELFLENGKSAIACNGSVMWVVKKTDSRKKVSYDTGIEFVNLKEEDKARVASIIEHVLKEGDSA